MDFELLRRGALDDAFDDLEHDRGSAADVHLGQPLVVSMQSGLLVDGDEKWLVAVARNPEVTEEVAIGKTYPALLVLPELQ